MKKHDIFYGACRAVGLLEFCWEQQNGLSQWSIAYERSGFPWLSEASEFLVSAESGLSH